MERYKYKRNQMLTLEYLMACVQFFGPFGCPEYGINCGLLLAIPGESMQRTSISGVIFVLCFSLVNGQVKDGWPSSTRFIMPFLLIPYIHLYKLSDRQPYHGPFQNLKILLDVRWSPKRFPFIPAPTCAIFVTFERILPSGAT
jgi:hypothetical protein